MIELNGIHNSCKIFTDNVDNATINQLITLLNQSSIKDSVIRIMPDTHAGAGCVIGTTMTLKDKVIPNLVGVDIGCGMHVVRLKDTVVDYAQLDKVIREHIPSGYDIRENEHKYCANLSIDNLRCKNSVNYDRAYKSVGTLGGGNHFIELNKDLGGDLYLVVHTGSRNLGKQIAEHYQNLARKSLSSNSTLVKETIERLKAEGRQQEIAAELKRIAKSVEKVPDELAYCEGVLFDDYIYDMKIAQDYAYWNRKVIVDTICEQMKWQIKSEFETIHNYIDMQNMILRKGAVSAKYGEELIIPMNMRDGSLLCIGKGNTDWNCSAPHGAGRLMSRSQAKQNLTVEAFQKTMEEAGIYTTSVGKDTLDECPMAYKPMQEIIDNVKDTVDIIEIIKPVYNFKAGERTERDLSMSNEDVDRDKEDL